MSYRITRKPKAKKNTIASRMIKAAIKAGFNFRGFRRFHPIGRKKAALGSGSEA